MTVYKPVLSNEHALVNETCSATCEHGISAHSSVADQSMKHAQQRVNMVSQLIAVWHDKIDQAPPLGFCKL